MGFGGSKTAWFRAGASGTARESRFPEFGGRTGDAPVRARAIGRPSDPSVVFAPVLGLPPGSPVACRENPAPFEGRFGPEYREARRLCAACPVRDACREDALEMGEHELFRGGLTPAELRREFEGRW
jgi:hypothetical protein